MKKEKPGDFLAQLGDELKSRGFRVGIGGYDQIFIDEAKRSVTRSRQAFIRKNFHLEAGAAPLQYYAQQHRVRRGFLSIWLTGNSPVVSYQRS
ncbi:MAG: hypothetical protein FJ241_06480 [Nitrospira sp.]|nr:hypothetical protein [Nitrospira sp.]